MFLPSNPEAARKAIAKKRRKGRMRPVRPSKSIEMKVRRRLAPYISRMIEDAKRAAENAGTPLQGAQLLEIEMRKWDAVFDDLSKNVAREWTAEANEHVKGKIAQDLTQKLGIDMAAVLDEPATKLAMEAASVEAAMYIRTIPQQHLGKVAKAVLTKFRQEQLPNNESLTDYIQRLGGMTRRHAQFIVRDQTSKMNAALVEHQSKSLGITQYEWVTADDERVVGNPSGLYPKGNRKHGNHYDRNGKTFDWNKPPFDGHPGQAINCRCVAIDIIDYGKLMK